METLLRQGSQLVYAATGGAKCLEKRIVELDTNTLRDLEKDEELSVALRKRFKGKNTTYLSPTFAQLVSWSLSTNWYSVNSNELGECG